MHQYRYALDRTIWEIPAGTLDNDEAPLACARRELEEEAGLTGGTWHRLGSVTPVPGYSDERIHLFLATDLITGRQRLDTDEILSVHTLDWDKALTMIGTGEIQDAKSISAMYPARHWLSKNTA